MDQNFIDFYAVLGVSPCASSDEIQRAFKQKAKETHPDHNDAPDAKERMQQLNEAREALLDPVKRALHDSKRKSHQEWVRLEQTQREASKKNTNASQESRTGSARSPHFGVGEALLWGTIGAMALSGLAFVVSQVGQTPVTRSNTWDPYVGRYRGPDGRFRSGPRR